MIYAGSLLTVTSSTAVSEFLGCVAAAAAARWVCRVSYRFK